MTRQGRTMKQPPRIRYTDEARQDFERCRQFLRRHSPDTVSRRTRELFSAVRRIVENPELNPVRKVDPDTGLHLRRCNVARFVVVYVYFAPNALEPAGLVSLRAFRHASEEDVFWEVRECASADALTRERPFLSTRVHRPWPHFQPLATHDEITFTRNAKSTDVNEIHDRQSFADS